MHRRGDDRTLPPETVTDLRSCWATSLARAVLALAHLACGEVVDCVEQIVDACGGSELPALNALDRAEAYEALAQAELARGQPAAADRWAQHAQTAAATLGLPAPTAFALLAHAHTLAARDPAAAARRALAAAEAFADAGRPLDENRARRLAERAAREQRRLGRRGPRHGHAAGAALALSDRELEVATLVAQGHTNRQIARQLGLSGKTVETYLARVFVKLGASSRAAVATMITKAQIPA